MATVLRTDPRADDALARESARIARQCCPSGSGKLAGVLGLHASQGTRMWHGERQSAFYRALWLVRGLCRDEDTSPFPLIAELRAVALREHLEERTTAWLVRRWHELVDREADAEAAQKRAGQHGTRAEYRQAMKDEAAVQLELAAIDEVLEARGEDPRAYRGDGWPLQRGAK